MHPSTLRLLLPLLWALLACKPEAPVPPAEPPLAARPIYVLNEGNFQWGNASLDLYYPDSGRVVSGAFSARNGRPLGDVLQSMTILGSRAFLVVNNTARVEVVDRETLASLGTIEGLTSPRYLLPVGPDKAYVTDLYAPHLHVVDLNTLTAQTPIPLPGWTEALIQVGTEVWVSHMHRPWLYVIDPSRDVVVDSVAVGLGGNSLALDAAGALWLLCAGDILTGSGGSLWRIDPAQRRVTWQGTFGADAHPGALRLNPAGDQLYFLLGGLRRLPVGQPALPAPLIVPAAGRTFYGLGVDPQTGIVYASDAIDYVQRGLVYRFTPDGERIDSFRTGIIPGGFYFGE